MVSLQTAGSVLTGSLARGARRGTGAVRRWETWQLGEPLRGFVLGVPVLALAAAAAAAVGTHWQVRQLAVFVALLACGAVAIEATRNVREPQGTVARDLQSVWYLAIAVALPPFYAFAAPIPLTIYKLWRTRRMLVYRRVFSNATISLAYGCASLLFHASPPGIAGSAPGTGSHAVTWTATVAACGVAGWLINHGLLLAAVKMSDPAARARELLCSRESVTSDLLELSLAVSLTLLVVINPVLMVLALPSVVLCRRYLMHVQLVAQARLDGKTGLLNAATWQREASAEFHRAWRNHAPLALAMVDIDHFESVRETAGRGVGDQLLRDIASMLKRQLRDQDVIGRFGRDEFAILLPRTGADEARRISERLRDHIASEPIAIGSGTQADFVFRLTICVGIAVLNSSRRALGELMGAADAALDQARSTGWNRVFVMPDGAAEAPDS
jgi:diguanylate cyclase (GGDEF)-like protein